jgi:hypothetical protein
MVISVRSVALPAEHGGWSLTLEPALLGLLVEPSAAGLALTGVALVAFLIRTPLKVALVDRHRTRRLDRTRLAERVAGGELLIALALLAYAIAAAEGAFWWPLAAAVPLVAVELWYDIRSRSRRLVPELAGSIGVAAVAAAVALAGGAASLVAAGLWFVAGARAVAAIPFVRVQIRRVKQQPHRLLASDAAQLAAVVAGAIGYAIDAVPLAGLISLIGLAAVHAVLVRRPAPAVPVLGAQQVTLGLAVVLATALGVRSP